MNTDKIETLLLQEMEDVKGGNTTPPTCTCDSGAHQGAAANGVCNCKSGAAQFLDPSTVVCYCPTGGGGSRS